MEIDTTKTWSGLPSPRDWHVVERRQDGLIRMSRKIRLWRHDGWWRIQFYQGQHKDRYGVLQEVWKSHRRYGSVMMFGSEQEARVYMQDAAKKARKR